MKAKRALFLTVLFPLLALGGIALGQRTRPDFIEINLETRLVPGPVQVGVLLPPGYEVAEEPLPLLLFLHGGGGSHQMLARLQDGFAAEWATAAFPEMVVVTPSAGRSFYVDYRDGSQLWETFLMEELLPLIRERFNVTSDPAKTLVSGVSMGGMGSLRLAFKYPEAFGAVAAMEPGIEPALEFDEIAPEDRFYRSDELYEELFGSPVDREYWRQNHPIAIAAERTEVLRESGLQIYLEVGDEDQFGLFRGTEMLHRILYDAGVPHEYRLVRGANHRVSQDRLSNALRFLGRVLQDDQ